MTKTKKDTAPKKNNTGLYLAINVFAFLSCWAAAMGFISWFDAPILIVLLFSTIAGYLQGSTREILNILFACLALIGAWVLGMLMVNITSFGFFLAQLHYAYLVWFVLFVPFLWYLSSKIVNISVKKTHKVKWLHKIDSATGFLTGLLKGVFLSYVFIAFLYFSSFSNLHSMFKDQETKSLAMQAFENMEKEYQVAETIDVFELRHFVSDIRNRLRFYNVMAELYPYEYQVQKYSLDLLVPLVYDKESLYHFYKTDSGKTLINTLEKEKEVSNLWKKEEHLRKILQKKHHTPKEILIILERKKVQEILSDKKIIDLLKKMTD